MYATNCRLQGVHILKVYLVKMVKKITISGIVLLFSAFVYGQTTQPVKPSVKTGEVVSVDQAKIVIRLDDATEFNVMLTDKTEFKRVAADKPSLATATAAVLADISIGDKLMTTGILSEDGKSFPARSVYLMTKTDIAKKQEKEKQEWRVRGIAGKVTAVNQQANQLTVEVRGLIGSTNVVVTPKTDATFKRYAPDSIKYEEAKDSSLNEIRAGDMIRALGDKSIDGTALAAEQIVTGAFQTVAGTVKSVDVEKGEVLISDLVTKKDVVVLLGGAAVVKKFPQEQAEQMARMQMMGMGGGPGGARPVGGGNPPAGQPAQQGAPGGRQMIGGARPGGAGGGVDDMLDRFPNITAADLKAGDMVALSSTKNGDNSRIKAIKFLAGVEPFLRLASAGNNAGGRGRGGVDGGFSIPGLDGIGFP